MSLYNEVRPSDFSEMVGNFDHVKNILKEPNHSHSFLFHGPSGGGKTSLGRVIAKELGATPIDILEYNFQDNKGVDTAREITSGIQLSPMGKCRVYIIDEFQGATPAAQKTLLKVIEEPPKHVYFILCAMDTSKIEPAILNRCTKVEFKSLSHKQLRQIVYSAIDKKGWESLLDDDAISLLIQKAEGSGREALNILEVLHSIPMKEQVKYMEGYNGLGDSENVALDRLAYLLYNTNTDWKTIANLINTFYPNGVEAEPARRYLLGYGVRSGVMNGKEKHMEVATIFTEVTFYNELNGFVVLCYKAWKVLNK